MPQTAKSNGLTVAVNLEATDWPNSHYAGAGAPQARCLGEVSRAASTHCGPSTKKVEDYR